MVNTAQSKFSTSVEHALDFCGSADFEPSSTTYWASSACFPLGLVAALVAALVFLLLVICCGYCRGDGHYRRRRARLTVLLILAAGCSLGSLRGNALLASSMDKLDDATGYCEDTRRAARDVSSSHRERE